MVTNTTVKDHVSEYYNSVVESNCIYCHIPVVISVPQNEKKCAQVINLSNDSVQCERFHVLTDFEQCVAILVVE